MKIVAMDTKHSPDRSGPTSQPEAPSADPSDPALGATEEAADTPDLAPMTFSLLGRFFAVPLLIIGTIVGGAVLVVLLFGGPAAPQVRTLMELLQVLEATSGEKSLGILLPREKELWQTALEVSVRLKNKDKEPDLTDGELTSVANRLGAMVSAGLANLDRIATSGAQRTHQREIRSKRLEFLIHALGRTERPEAVEMLVDVLRDGREPYVQAAIQELGDLHAMPGTRQAIGPIVALLSGSTQAETRLLACTVLSVLATGDDQPAIEALKSARLTAEAEVAWSAALALARLGSDAGKSTLLDLLDRSFLESGDRYHSSDRAGTVHRYPMPPQRVDALLMAAIDAALNLKDVDLWAMIEQLKSDSSSVVRARAGKALDARGSVVVNPAGRILEE